MADACIGDLVCNNNLNAVGNKNELLILNIYLLKIRHYVNCSIENCGMCYGSGIDDVRSDTMATHSKTKEERGEERENNTQSESFSMHNCAALRIYTRLSH